MILLGDVIGGKDKKIRYVKREAKQMREVTLILPFDIKEEEARLYFGVAKQLRPLFKIE